MIMPTATDTQFTIERTTEIDATPDQVFEAILSQLDGNFATGQEEPLPMKLERVPGGRWYRDLGDDAGHCWGFVQAIKPGNLVEIWGPLFMSLAVVNNVQYRLSEGENGGSVLTFHHRAYGDVPVDDIEAFNEGWSTHIDRVKVVAEA